jgi:nucleotide-binding universal stress UspA family protein
VFSASCPSAAKEKVVKKILVGIDGSPESRKAAERAADLAAVAGWQVVLAYVISLPLHLAPEPSYLEQWDVAERDYAGKLLEDIAAPYRKRGITVETVTPSGAAAEVLADMASRQNVDMVVVGHKGRGAISRLLLGSVADRLVQISPKPVLVSR